MDKQNNVSEVWPYNLMKKILDEEAYQKWETQIPESFHACLDYYLYTTFSERNEGIIRKFYQENWKPREIAEHYGLTTQSIRNIMKDCLRCMSKAEHRDFITMGYSDFLNKQMRIAYAKGYRRGFEHGSDIWSFDLVHNAHKASDYMRNLPGCDQSIHMINFQNRNTSGLLRDNNIYTLSQLLEFSAEELQEKIGLGKTAIEDINWYLKRTGRKQLTGSNAPKKEAPDISCWPWNLIHEAFPDETWDNYVQNLPDEAEESFNMMFRTTLTQEDQQLLELRFKEKLSYGKIERVFDAKPDFARRRIWECFYKLRHPSRLGIIRYGVKGYILHRLQAESERGYRDGFDKGVDIREMEYGSDCDL